MSKYAIRLLVATFAIAILASFVKGSATNAERAENQRQCMADPGCSQLYDYQK